ncbi:MAG: amidohydrolase family protein [Thermodesulfobacteriota bacterium]
MKVIDFHLHVGTKDHWNPWLMDFFRTQNPTYTSQFAEQVTPQRLISYLRSQGVDRAVVLSEYAPQSTGVVSNEFTSSFCRGHDELIPFGAPCLYSDIPLERQAEHAVRELGMRGFKMLPTYAHFYPNDHSLFPFYEVVRDLGVPLVFHTGTSIFKGSRVKYGDPLLLDDVAEQFPELKIVLEHGGRPFWYDRAGWMITRHKNVYIGIAGIPARQLLEHFPHLPRYPERFIFGSDWPGVPDIRSYVERIRDLPLDQGIIESVLWENAKELLRL